jgi:predicted nucleic acid-binding protein
VNVYVESNFVLELALVQEQHSSCEEILRLCESGSARLIVPAYSLMEPYETLLRRQADRRQLKGNLDAQFRQIARTALYRDRLPELEVAMSLLVDSAGDDISRLDSVRSRLLACAEVAPLEGQALHRAEAQRAARELSAQDAVVYASILVHLERSAEPGCFMTRDADFGVMDIKRELRELQCKLLVGFDAGLRFLRRSALEGAPPA